MQNAGQQFHKRTLTPIEEDRIFDFQNSDSDILKDRSLSLINKITMIIDNEKNSSKNNSFGDEESNRPKLIESERKFLFDYIIEQTEIDDQKYASNLIKILNYFFNYGFQLNTQTP